jgi:hypothetical protein
MVKKNKNFIVVQQVRENKKKKVETHTQIA